jgi:large subunit ribosomal protein L36
VRIVLNNNPEVLVKVRNSIKSMKKMPGSQVVRRRGRVFVINKLNPRFKARLG